MTETSPENLPALTSKEKKYLKGLAHPLSAVIQIGKEGVSERLIAAMDQELLIHELIKVKIGNNSGLEKHETSSLLAATTASHLVQLIGKTIVLYRANPKKPKGERILLPKE
jgi:RNA-binding protein